MTTPPPKEYAWAMLVFNNPMLLDPTKRLDVRGVRSMFEIVWNAGYSAGADAMTQRLHEIHDTGHTNAHHIEIHNLPPPDYAENQNEPED